MHNAELTARDDDFSRAASLDKAMRGIVAEYRSHAPRDSLDAVWRLRRALAPADDLLRIGVVGTNGKTSAATYLSRLLTAAGARTGLYVSPHLGDWTERVRVDGSTCGHDELLRAVTEIHELARSELGDLEGLRFFDALTLAAERLFGDAGARFGVFEAGIGGRLDAVRVLEPPLVLLTSVAIDHAEMLGEELSDVLREKLLVAPTGALIGSLPLPEDLAELAERTASERGARIAWVDPNEVGQGLDPGLPAYLRSALALARWGASAVAEVAGAGGTPPGSAGALSAADLQLPGRVERGAFEGVPYVLDVAHNQAAWIELSAELARIGLAGETAAPLTALISVSPDKRIDGLPDALNALRSVRQTIVTTNGTMPALDPRVLGAALEGRAKADVLVAEEVAPALAAAFDDARQSNGTVLVFGSTHLVGTVRRLLAGGGAQE